MGTSPKSAQARADRDRQINLSERSDEEGKSRAGGDRTPADGNFRLEKLAQAEVYTKAAAEQKRMAGPAMSFLAMPGADIEQKVPLDSPVQESGAKKG
jgi:hypothetical protein